MPVKPAKKRMIDAEDGLELFAGNACLDPGETVKCNEVCDLKLGFVAVGQA